MSFACITKSSYLKALSWYPNSDAQRPCSTCTKTHAHYIAPFVARGESFEPRPNCTYDDDEPSQEGPRTTETLGELAPIHVGVHAEVGPLH